MKKGIFIAVGVVALLAVMIWADHKFPAGGGASGNAPSKPTNAPKVTFWATWCAPCKVEIPWMIEFQQKYSPRGFTILGVSMDEDGKKAIEPFLDKERFDVNGQKVAMNYPILLGNDAIADKFGGILGLPTSMLFTRDGKKVRTIVGLVNHDDISKAIESLL
jgi:cytochrome c biogenesis protein CcmG/thiol:disulfide interchange protein DsbE